MYGIHLLTLGVPTGWWGQSFVQGSILCLDLYHCDDLCKVSTGQTKSEVKLEFNGANSARAEQVWPRLELFDMMAIYLQGTELLGIRIRLRNRAVIGSDPLIAGVPVRLDIPKPYLPESCAHIPCR
jgi:hypothetical protein